VPDGKMASDQNVTLDSSLEILDTIVSKSDDIAIAEPSKVEMEFNDKLPESSSESNKRMSETRGMQNVWLTMDRKDFLLRKARDERLQWIRSVPLPYYSKKSDHSQSLSFDLYPMSKEVPSIQRVIYFLYGTESSSTIQKIEKIQRDNSHSQDKNKVSEIINQMGDDAVKPVLEDYQAFLSRLEKPESAALVSRMRQSLTQLGSDTTEALGSIIASTLEHLQRLEGSDLNIITMHKRSLESFLYGHVQDKVSKYFIAEKQEDEKFHERLLLLSFLTPKHLDLESFVDDDHIEDYLAPAKAALLSLQEFFSPYEKLQRVLRTYRCIHEALKKATDGKLIPSADDVLPTLILAVIKAQPRNLISNLAFIEKFSSPEYLMGETGYAYTNLYGAVQYLKDLDLTPKSLENGTVSSLTISHDELQAGLEKSRKSLTDTLNIKAIKGKYEVVVPTEAPLECTYSISISKVREARINGEVIDMQWARQQQSNAVSTMNKGTEESIGDPTIDLPKGFNRSYSFLTSRPGDITIQDLPKLLQEYRMLVHTTETLLGARLQNASLARKERFMQAEQEIQIRAIAAELGAFE
jgi:Vacuolar sorting protein 9 (VPS9) domain